MSAQQTIAALRVPSLRGPLPTARVGSLIQAAQRTEIDEDGNPKSVIIEVERAEVLTYLAADGSPFADLLPETKEPHKAMGAAITRAKKGQAETRNGEDVLNERLRWTRVGVDSEGVLKCTLEVKHPDPETGRTHSTDVVVIETQKSGGTNVTVLRPDLETANVIASVNEVLRRYRSERLMLHANDMRVFVNRVFDAVNAVNVGASLHFVGIEKETENTHRTEFDVLFASVERALIAAGYTVVIAPQVDGSSVGGNVASGLLAKVARAANRVEALVGEWKDEEGKNVELGSFDKRDDELADLTAMLDIFADVTGEANADALSALNAAKDLSRKTKMAMLF
jgi:hypothetical protein